MGVRNEVFRKNLNLLFKILYVPLIICHRIYMNGSLGKNIAGHYWIHTYGGG